MIWARYDLQAAAIVVGLLSNIVTTPITIWTSLIGQSRSQAKSASARGSAKPRLVVVTDAVDRIETRSRTRSASAIIGRLPWAIRTAIPAAVLLVVIAATTRGYTTMWQPWMPYA